MYCTYITAYHRRFSFPHGVLRAHKITKIQRPREAALGKINYFCEHEREGARKAPEGHKQLVVGVIQAQ